MCGAEKLPQPLAKEFKEKFGVLPLEGYGCTELSPAAAANVPDWRDRRHPADRQQARHHRPAACPASPPASSTPRRCEPLPPGQEGLLLIYGANVMKGYLGKPELTQEGHPRRLVRHRRHRHASTRTASSRITGRLSRFAKVGGEMVPLEKVEEELHSILGTNERVCAVTAVPDEKRGERLIVLTPISMAWTCRSCRSN